VSRLYRNLIIFTVIVSFIFLGGCCTSNNNRSIDNRPPLINTDNFWDFIPWWHTNSITLVETNNVTSN